MNIAEKMLLTIIFGSVLPIMLFLVGWWASFRLVQETMIIVFALSGLVLGILLDALFLRKWFQKPYQTSTIILILIYFFYSAGIFGFFMGIPVFNLLTGLAAGIFAGRKAHHDHESMTAFKSNNNRLHTDRRDSSGLIAVSADQAGSPGCVWHSEAGLCQFAAEKPGGEVITWKKS